MCCIILWKYGCICNNKQINTLIKANTRQIERNKIHCLAKLNENVHFLLIINKLTRKLQQNLNIVKESITTLVLFNLYY